MKLSKAYIKYIIDCIRYCHVLSHWMKIGEFMCPLGTHCRGSKCKCYFNGQCGYLAVFDELKAFGTEKLGLDKD